MEHSKVEEVKVSESHIPQINKRDLKFRDKIWNLNVVIFICEQIEILFYAHYN